MKKTTILQTVLLTSTLLVIIPEITALDVTDIFSHFSHANKINEKANKVEWLSFSDLDLRIKEAPKPVMIDVYTNWCGWCKRMDATTFKDEKVVSVLAGNYYAVKLNAESEELINFRGKKQPMYMVARELGVRGFPTVVLTDPTKEKSKTIVGFQKANAMHKQLLKFID